MGGVDRVLGLGGVGLLDVYDGSFGALDTLFRCGEVCPVISWERGNAFGWRHGSVFICLFYFVLCLASF